MHAAEAAAAPADTAKTEVLEAKKEEAPVDSAALAKAEADKKAAEAAAKEEAEEKARAEGENQGVNAKTTIMENPWEFLIVSAAFVASVRIVILEQIPVIAYFVDIQHNLKIIKSPPKRSAGIQTFLKKCQWFILHHNVFSGIPAGS